MKIKQIFKGDAIEIMEQMAKNNLKVDMSIFSPPFSSLYTYTNSNRDLGNVRSLGEFFMHLRFFVNGLSKIVKDGRMVVVHLTQIPETKGTHGRIRLRDIRGGFISVFEEFDFAYWGESVVDKDPQLVAIRKKNSTIDVWNFTKRFFKMSPCFG